MPTKAWCEATDGTLKSLLIGSYFVAANPSIDRHIYSAALPKMPSVETFAEELTALTDAQQPGYFDVSFSPGAGYYLLSYRGPDVPYQRLIEAKEEGM